MRKPLLLFSALFLQALFAADAKREVVYIGDLAPLNITPTFDSGYLAVYGGDQEVLVYARDGSLAFRFTPPHGFVVNAAFEADGSPAFGVQALNPRRGVISIADAKGKQIGVIDTGDYVPSGVSFAPDHSIWAVGWKPELVGAGVPEYEVLRHYSREGRELGRYLSRASFPGEHAPARGATGMWNLRIAGDRIGALLGGGRKWWWVEAAMSGQETGRWQVDDWHGYAVTSDGVVYFQSGGGVMSLDRASGQWRATRISVPNGGFLIGAEGSELVFGTGRDRRLLLRVSR